ncbi:MAG: phosphatase, partial [Egibacteraceae bacterium]
VADHGLAGAAIARGLPTISIADVNDPGLPLAQVRGRTDGVLAIDDNLAPRHFLAVTEAMLAW